MKFLIILIFLLSFGVCNAGQLNLAWDANSEENLSGYKLYYDIDKSGSPYEGTGITEGDSPIVITLDDLNDKNSPVYTLNGLLENTTYYFTLTAFDSDNLESDYADELLYIFEVKTFSIPKKVGEYEVDGFLIIVSLKKYKYSGNISSKVFHTNECRYFECKTCTEHFSTYEEAINAGYRPCGICKPEEE